MLRNVVDADRAYHGALGAAGLGAWRIPPPQEERDVTVSNAFGRVAVEQHGCDPTITRWLIAMAPMFSPVTRTESPARPNNPWKWAWSSRTRRPVSLARWCASNTVGWSSRTGTGGASGRGGSRGPRRRTQAVPGRARLSDRRGTGDPHRAKAFGSDGARAHK